MLYCKFQNDAMRGEGREWDLKSSFAYGLVREPQWGSHVLWLLPSNNPVWGYVYALYRCSVRKWSSEVLCEKIKQRGKICAKFYLLLPKCGLHTDFSESSAWINPLSDYSFKNKLARTIHQVHFGTQRHEVTSTCEVITSMSCLCVWWVALWAWLHIWVAGIITPCWAVMVLLENILGIACWRKRG